MRITPTLWQLLPSATAALLNLIALDSSPAKAQTCTVDPFGAEVCLPPDESIEPPNDPPNTPPPFVIIPECFGPCWEFPPAPPYRAFEAAADPEPTPEPAEEPPLMPAPPAEPIQPLWFKSDALESEVAEAYLERKLNDYFLAQTNQAVIDLGDAPIVVFDGIRYAELLTPNTLLYSQTTNEPGVNVWVRGFGGESKAPSSRGRIADISGGGAQLGFDVPLSNSSRIGLFGTYAVNDGDDGSRGTWDTDGWGGGGYAEYWSENFYLRGMVSAGGYSGDQRRSNDGEIYRGERSGNSWTGVVSVGAPFDSGDWILEPQALISYTNTSLDRYSESTGNRDDRLLYNEMELDRFDSELSMTFAHPIRDGQRSLFMPFLRVGWVADWGQSGGSQKVSFINADRNDNWSINGDSDHGALVEIGLDYTTYNFSDTSMGVYARSGVVLWGGDRGTAWQVSGGLNFKF
ncbi:hypothetical protein KR100_13075 [Synechococcus sp. KORDI-100]|uniref:autotransporter outer membrane beta-barrel domain-containing protein n=1 Tax=Synechococcus sp. KORDI-100 TaxID=1280380 RepID=UPI0004E06AE9|nr:autotransporter outer membrane beta-barrel domain-containing protein [Synechococcus sp. KORDI-100]AII44282.1 hypothetical protein KR100_13075 [Synechococcus sp. KORDI-100]